MPRKTLEEIVVNRSWCKGCRICVEFCPASVFILDEEEKAVPAHPDACTLCGLCERLCPDLAIEVRVAAGDRAEAGV